MIRATLWHGLLSQAGDCSVRIGLFDSGRGSIIIAWSRSSPVNSAISSTITRRFDVRADGSRLQQEDLASLAYITKQTYGGNFKCDALDYVDIGNLVRKYIPAWPIDIVRYFDLVLFNFVFANGDAHVKNFSVIQTTCGDYRLTPAYDLINTLLHIPSGSIFTLSKGLYPGWNPEFGISGSDFMKYGTMIGLDEKTARDEIDRFCADYALTNKLIDHSFLSDTFNEKFKQIYRTRIFLP